MRRLSLIQRILLSVGGHLVVWRLRLSSGDLLVDDGLRLTWLNIHNLSWLSLRVSLNHLNLAVVLLMLLESGSDHLFAPLYVLWARMLGMDFADVIEV